MQEFKSIMEQVIQAMNQNNIQLAQQKMNQLKPLICNLDSIDPIKNVIIQDEIIMARLYYEISSKIALNLQDYQQYEQNMLILRVFYEDYQIISLNNDYAYYMSLYLLFLVSFNRFSEFHSVLELIPFKFHISPDIQLVLSIQSCLQQGNYNQIRKYCLNQTNPLKQLLNRIDHTIRFETARNIEKAYDSLSLNEAIQILNLQNLQEFNQFIQNQKQQEMIWTVKNDRIYFIKQDVQQNQINADQSIQTMINYTVELDKVI